MCYIAWGISFISRLNLVCRELQAVKSGRRFVLDNITDSDLHRMITSALQEDPRVDMNEVDVRVQRGVVYLSGEVDSAAERHAIQESIRSTGAAGSVVDELTLRNYVERTDDELRGAVKQALIRDISIDAGNVEIDTAGGAVTLRGHVSSYAQKMNAETVAWWTPGVINVTNRLDVDGLGDTPEDIF